MVEDKHVNEAGGLDLPKGMSLEELKKRFDRPGPSMPIEWVENPHVPNIGAAQAIRKAFEGKTKWDRSAYVGASEIADCSLKLFWDKTREGGFTGNGKTERGHAIEVALIKLLKQGGMDIRYHDGHVNHQQELRFDDTLRGHPDGIIYEDGSAVAVLEIKSVGSERFKYQKGNWLSSKWSTQASLNAALAHLPYALIIEVDASDLENIRETTVDAMGDTDVQQYAWKAAAIIRAISEPPIPLAEPSQENCKWCAWKSECRTAWTPREEIRKVVTDAPQIEVFLDSLQRAKELGAAASDMKSSAEKAIFEVARENDAAQLSCGNRLAVVGIYKGRVTVDNKRLRAEHPEIEFAGYEKIGEDSPTLRVKEIAEQEEGTN